MNLKKKPFPLSENSCYDVRLKKLIFFVWSLSLGGSIREKNNGANTVQALYSR